MSDSAAGHGQAFNPTVDTTSPVPEDDPRVPLEAAVDGAQRKVDKCSEALVDAERALAEAQAALAAYEEN